MASVVVAGTAVAVPTEITQSAMRGGRGTGMRGDEDGDSVTGGDHVAPRQALELVGRLKRVAPYEPVSGHRRPDWC
jgi:hypothetical protein